MAKIEGRVRRHCTAEIYSVFSDVLNLRHSRRTAGSRHIEDVLMSVIRRDSVSDKLLRFAQTKPTNRTVAKRTKSRRNLPRCLAVPSVRNLIDSIYSSSSMYSRGEHTLSDFPVSDMFSVAKIWDAVHVSSACLAEKIDAKHLYTQHQFLL